MIEKNGIVPENNEWRCETCKKYEKTHGMCEYCRYEPIVVKTGVSLPEPSRREECTSV